MSDDSQQSPDQSLGFANPAQPKQEKYNTQFIVANLEKDKQRTKLIVLGVIVAAACGVGMLMLLGSGDDPAKRAAEHTASAAASATAAAAEAKPAPEAKPTEH